MDPRNSTEVAIKLVDKARKLGLPVKMECSLITRSDSRYVILFPGEPCEVVIRISSHPPTVKKYDLYLGVQRPELLKTAVALGRNFLDTNYGTSDQIQAARKRQQPAAADVHHARRSGNGHLQRRGLQTVQRSDQDLRDWVRCRNPRRVRVAGPKPKWLGSKAGRVRDEWTGDD